VFDCCCTELVQTTSWKSGGSSHSGTRGRDSHGAIAINIFGASVATDRPPPEQGGGFVILSLLLRIVL
jgi:hypothetical protein